jgi:hypothetical protein
MHPGYCTCYQEQVRLYYIKLKFIIKTTIMTSPGSRRLCLFILIVLCISLTAGCINTYDREFKKVTDLVQSATVRLEVLKGIDPKNPSAINVAAIRSSTAGAKADLNEALRILEQDIPPDAMVAGRKNLDALKTMIRVYAEYCDMIGGPMADALEHSLEIPKLTDPAAVRTKAMEVLGNFQDMKLRLAHMNQELATIDVSGLQPEIRGTVVQLKAAFISLEQETDLSIVRIQEIVKQD